MPRLTTFLAVLAVSAACPLLVYGQRHPLDRGEREIAERPARAQPVVAKLAVIRGERDPKAAIAPVTVRGIVVPSPHVGPSDDRHLRPKQSEGYCGLGWGPHIQVWDLDDDEASGPVRIPLARSGKLAVGSVPYGAAVQVTGKLVRERRDSPCTGAGPGAVCMRGRVVCRYVEATRLRVLDCDSDYRCGE